MKPNVYKSMASIEWTKPIVIDFESYYGKDWSLSRITTEKYIRGEKWECIGVSVKDGDEKTVFHRGEDGIPVLREMAEKQPLRPFVSHNNLFDMGILGLRYNIHPSFMVDTAVMAKLCALDRFAGGAKLADLSDALIKLGKAKKRKGTAVRDMNGVHRADMSEKQWKVYEEYCKLDSDLCHSLYTYMIGMVDARELAMCSLTTEMFTNPAFEIDSELLKSYTLQMEGARNAMLENLGEKVGITDLDELTETLRSPLKFASLLESIGVPPPTKFSKRTGKQTFAFDKTDSGFNALLDSENELVRDLAMARVGVSSSIERTRAASFIDISTRGSLPIPLRYAAAHTGRYGGTDKINVQNLSKRSREPVLRRSMRAPKGYVVVASDSNQIEARLMAYAAGQEDKVRLFLDGRDPYVDMAAEIYGKTYDEIYEISKVHPTKEGKVMRGVGKQTELACGYGMSGATFRERMLQDGNDEAAEMAEVSVGAFRRKNDRVVQFWRTCDRALHVMLAGGAMEFGGDDGKLFRADGSAVFHGKRISVVEGPNGARMYYENLRRIVDDQGRLNYAYDQRRRSELVPKTIWGSMLAENCIQFLAFAVLKWQAVEIAKLGIPIHMNVHDEWVSVVPKEMAGRTAYAHWSCMRKAPSYIRQGLLDCEVSIGENYADLKPLDVASFVRAEDKEGIESEGAKPNVAADV